MEYPKIEWFSVEEGTIELDDPENFPHHQSLYDVNTGDIFFMYFPALGEGNFIGDWCEYVIEELIDLCILSNEGSIISFEVVKSIVKQKVRSEKVDTLLSQ